MQLKEEMCYFYKDRIMQCLVCLVSQHMGGYHHYNAILNFVSVVVVVISIQLNSVKFGMLKFTLQPGGQSDMV